MSYVPLTGGSYVARSLTVGAQTCINLMPEAMPQAEGEPTAFAHYPTPGLRYIGVVGGGAWRGMYRATNGTLFGVVGNNVVVNADTGGSIVGTIATTSGPVSMSDNSVNLILVDGSAAGYTVLLATGAFSAISDPAFYGADRVEMLDTFFVLNRPGTNQFYVSRSVAVTFDPLYIAAKAGLDTLVSIAVFRRELWLFGTRYTEIWSDVGAADFPFQVFSGGIEHGCVAAASVAHTDGAVFWLDRSRDGEGIVLRGQNYNAMRVSTHAIEAAIRSYSKITDAVGWIYQIDGHIVYVLTFPTAGATWCFDLATSLWHQWQSGGGIHRGICHSAFSNYNLVGDVTNGNLYALDPNVYTDNGAPIQRTRAFPHLESNADRIFYTRFTADMQCGLVPVGQPEPQLSLRWSDDGGFSFGAPVALGMGLNGAANTSLQFRRLGYSRGGRVFEVSWNAPVATVLQGAWVETVAGAT